jgi:hypothetical protein
MTTGLRHIATEPAGLNNKYFIMDKKRSPLPLNKIKSVAGAASDSVSRRVTYMQGVFPLTSCTAFPEFLKTHIFHFKWVCS